MVAEKSPRCCWSFFTGVALDETLLACAVSGIGLSLLGAFCTLWSSSSPSAPLATEVTESGSSFDFVLLFEVRTAKFAAEPNVLRALVVASGVACSTSSDSSAALNWPSFASCWCTYSLSKLALDAHDCCRHCLYCFHWLVKSSLRELTGFSAAMSRVTA